MDERVECLRRFLEAFNHLDDEAACEVADPNVRFTVIAEQVSGALPDGHEGIRLWMQEARRVWESLRAEVSEDDVEVRGEWVLASGRTDGVARETGRQMSWPWTAIAKVVGGKIASFGIYLSRDEALAALRAEASQGDHLLPQ